MAASKFLPVMLFFAFLFLLGFSGASLSPNNDIYTADDMVNPGVFSVPAERSDGVLANDVNLATFDFINNKVLFQNGVLHGDLYLNEDGSFDYIANFGFHGVGYFDYVINDGEVNSSSARVYLGVNNSITSAKMDVYDVDEISGSPGFFGLSTLLSDGILVNDLNINKGLFDSDGDYIWVILKKDVSKGSLDLFSDGSFDYLANSGFHGVDSFSYSISDGHSDSASVKVYLGVNNSAPIARQDKYLIDGSINTTNSIGVLANDTDVDNDELELSVTEDVKFGELKITGTGFSVNGSFNYTSNKSNGVDYFVYELTDYHLSDSAKSIFIIGTNTAPVAKNDSYYTSANKKLNVSAFLGVLANDADAEDDVLFIDLLNSTLNGSLILNDDGSFNYTPDTGFVGVDSFIYRLTDLDKDSENVTVTIYVNTSVINNVVDDADNETDSGDNVTVNVSSEVYPLILNFQLVNSTGSIVNEYNFTANSSADVPTNYSVPTGLAAGNYTLYLSLYDSDKDLLNKTVLAEFEVEAPMVPITPTTTGGGNGGSSRRIQNVQNLTDNNTIPNTNTGLNNQSTNNTLVTNQTTNPGFFNTITGNVIGTTAGRWSLGIVVFLILVGLAWWIVAAKKRKVAQNTKPAKKGKN